MTKYAGMFDVMPANQFRVLVADVQHLARMPHNYFLHDSV